MPLYVQKYSEIDINFFQNIKDIDLKIFFFVIGEIGQHVVYSYASKNLENRVDKSIVVFDLDDINVFKTFYGLQNILKASQEVLDVFYPETLHKLYVVNSGKFFF